MKLTMNIQKKITMVLSVGLMSTAIQAVGDELPPLLGIDQEGLTTFEANTPAVADEVNDNFTEIIAAINANANRINRNSLA